MLKKTHGTKAASECEIQLMIGFSFAEVVLPCSLACRFVFSSVAQPKVYRNGTVYRFNSEELVKG